ncbi:MAG: hypothetical protein ACP5EN_11860 [Rhodovulum sp.]
MSAILTDLPEAAADTIGALLPELRQCQAIAGRFNLERLKAEQVHAPAVLVSLIGLRQHEGWAGPRHGYLADMAAFIVTTDRAGLPRDTAAAAMAAVIAAAVPDRDWGLADCGEADDVQAQPLVSAGSERARASLWAVTWKQPLVMTPLPRQTPADLTLYVGESPEIGAAFEPDYDEIGGEA